MIESPELASFYRDVFMNDFSTEYGDTVRFDDAYPSVSGIPLESEPPGTYPVVSYPATVRPVFSPDNSYGLLRTFVSSAEKRLYAEQMDLSQSLVSETGDTPIGWMSESAGRGADVRLILDASASDGGQKEEAAERIRIMTGIDARAVNGGDGFTLIHNKGVV